CATCTRRWSPVRRSPRASRHGTRPRSRRPRPRARSRVPPRSRGASRQGATMEAARFERQVRTEASEVFVVYGGARRIGRLDLHYARFEVHGTLISEVELTDDEVQQLIDQIDEELVQTHDPEREDFLVTVYRGEELGFYSDEYDSDDEEE